MLSADFSQLAREVRSVERAGCKWLHLDIMDNHFVPNLTFGPGLVKSLRKISKRLFFDAHLMIEDPLSMLHEFADAGVQNMTIHQEACKDQTLEALKAIKKARMKAGVSIKPKTPVSAIEALLGVADIVLVMTVEPGFGGQALIPSCLNKVRALKKLREQRKLSFRIEADGGIHPGTIQLAVAAGSDILVAGSAVFLGGEIAANIETLRAALRHP